MLQIKGKSVNMLAAVRGSPVAEADGDVVEKSIVGSSDGFEGVSDYDDHVQEEERMVFVRRLGRSTACFTTAIVDRVSLLEHLNSSGSIKVSIMHKGQEIFH